MNQLQMEMAASFQKENLSALVDEYIRNKILRGLYKSGDRVLETDIAEELGISRGPVREGIKIAEQAGILTVEPRRGAYVTKFDEHDVREVFEIRVLLENSILEDLIKNQSFTQRDYLELKKIIDDMVDIVHSAMDEDEIEIELNKKDILFHQYIWRKSGNKRKEKILNEFFFQLKLAMLYDTKITKDLLKTATDHYKIIDYLRDGDLENCKKAVEDHILTFYNMNT